MDQPPTTSQSAECLREIPEPILQTEPRPTTPMRELISLPPPVVGIHDYNHPRSATICMWQLFNRSGQYWLKGAKCARSRTFDEQRASRLEQDPICSIDSNDCIFICVFCLGLCWEGLCTGCSSFRCCMSICRIHARPPSSRDDIFRPAARATRPPAAQSSHSSPEDTSVSRTSPRSPSSTDDVSPSGAPATPPSTAQSFHSLPEEPTGQNDPPVNITNPPQVVPRRSPEMKYIVVGLLNPESGGVREQLEIISDTVRLFKSLRKATKDLRPFYIRLLSLKTIGGFGLYRCEPSGDYHVPIDLDNQSSATLHELFMAYSSGDVDREPQWTDWVHQHLNGSSTDPQAGKYTLRLVLRWSIVKLVIYTTIPVALSLGIGLWFMFGASQGLDDSYTAVVQTAWTVSSYIVTSAGVIIALLAAVTALGDKP